MDQYVVAPWAWPALALVNAGLAEQKNRSRINWFIVSLVLGPFATFLIVVWAPAPVRVPDPPREGPTWALLGIGIGLVTVSVIPFVGAAMQGGPWWLWAIGAGLVVAGAACIATQVVVMRRWRELQAGRPPGKPTAPGAG